MYIVCCQNVGDRLCTCDGFTKPTGCKRFLGEASLFDLFGVEKRDRLENWFKSQDPGSVYLQFPVVSHREERDLPNAWPVPSLLFVLLLAWWPSYSSKSRR